MKEKIALVSDGRTRIEEEIIRRFINACAL